MENADRRNGPSPRGAGRQHARKPGSARPLRVELAEIDQGILKLLLQRHNLLAKLKKGGRLDPADEKYIRESWQTAVARVSRDPDLSGRFFTLLQQLSFLPRDNPEAREGGEGSQRKAIFKLAPAQAPIHAELEAPLSQWSTLAWMYLAAASGQALRLSPCLLNDSEIDFIRCLVQLGAKISREENAIIARESPPIATTDRIMHMGNCVFGFYLLLAHFLGRPARIKFTGGVNLKMADLSPICRILPMLNARLVLLVPKSAGLPARLESAGFLPPGISLPADVDPLFAEALILAAIFFPSPFGIDLDLVPARETILAHVVPELEKCGASFSLQGNTVSLEPDSLAIPPEPALPMDAELASCLLSFVAPLTGEVRLGGKWPAWPETERAWECCRTAGWSRGDDYVLARAGTPLSKFMCASCADLPQWAVPLLVSVAACVSLRGGSAQINPAWLEDADVNEFLRVAGICAGANGELDKGEPYGGPGWNAPDADWAIALAVAACSRTGKSPWNLGNPAVIMDLWPSFWVFYNSLPNPCLKRPETGDEEEKPKRRRILTNMVAELPEERSGD